MRDPGSRYANVATELLTLPDGRVVTCLRRRLLPQGSEMGVAQEVALMPGERLDQIAARLLGDGSAAWRIADANDAMYPAELEEDVGIVLRIATPQV